MTLGLGLQGGVHFLMEVDQEAALGKRQNAYMEEIRTALREARIGGFDVSGVAGGIRIGLSLPSELAKVQSLLTVAFPQLLFVPLPEGQGLGLKASVSHGHWKTMTF